MHRKEHGVIAMAAQTVEQGRVKSRFGCHPVLRHNGGLFSVVGETGFHNWFSGPYLHKMLDTY